MIGKVKLQKVRTNHTEVPNASAIWVYKEREKERERGSLVHTFVRKGLRYKWITAPQQLCYDL